jgi:hypothetical protein
MDLSTEELALLQQCVSEYLNGSLPTLERHGMKVDGARIKLLTLRSRLTDVLRSDGPKLVEKAG